MSSANKDSLFQEIVSSSFSDLRNEQLKQLALAIWYEDFTPDVSHLMPSLLVYQTRHYSPS